MPVWILTFRTFQDGGGVPQQGSFAGGDVDGPQDKGRASALRAAALGTWRKIVRLLSYVMIVQTCLMGLLEDAIDIILLQCLLSILAHG